MLTLRGDAHLNHLDSMASDFLLKSPGRRTPRDFISASLQIDGWSTAPVPWLRACALNHSLNSFYFEVFIDIRFYR